MRIKPPNRAYLVLAIPLAELALGEFQIRSER